MSVARYNQITLLHHTGLFQFYGPYVGPFSLPLFIHLISVFLFSILNSHSLGGNLSANGHLREIQVSVFLCIWKDKLETNLSFLS